MMKYLTKFATDIFPSVAATVIGAYIVNHYIVAKPDAPPVAAVSNSPLAADGKPADKPASFSSLPEAGVTAKGMSERTLIERSASEKAVVIEKPHKKPTEKSVGAKSADISAETGSIPAEPRRHREKAVAKGAPPPVPAPALSAAAPAPSAPPPPVEAAAPPENRRDANNLARAAIERLRGTDDNAPPPPETARAPDTPSALEVARGSETPRSSPAVRPLPPPIMVSTSPNEADVQALQPKPDAANGAMDGPRPTPPADIPLSQPPLEIRADAAGASARENTTVAEDVLSAAKSVFHVVLPR